MMNCTFIDYDNKEINTEVTSECISIKIKDRADTVQQIINLKYEEFDNIADEVRKQTDEKTYEELENMIIDLVVENEELKDLIEQQEEHADHVREKNFEVF